MLANTVNSSFFKLELQLLRDKAEQLCHASVEASDRDAADAWERIGVALSDVLLATKNDFATIKSRDGLFQNQ